MTTLVRFMDNPKTGVWANIRMDNGDPCWVGIAQSGVMVKISKVGLMGAKLFDESNVYKCAAAAIKLAEQYPNDLTPSGMQNPVLKSFVNSILHCSNLGQVATVLNSAYEGSNN